MIQQEATLVFIIDDHRLVLDGLRMLIESSDALELAGMADNGKEGIQRVADSKADILLLDIEMPHMNGIEVCKTIKIKLPDVKIIALTMLVQPSIISAMKKAGADGFIVKNTGSKELLFAIQQVIQGEEYYSAEVKISLEKGLTIQGTSQQIPQLSRREKEITKLIMESMSTKEIAAQLFISEGTVETHRKNILRKLNVKNSAGLVKMVMENRLLS
ncbi:response regulator [Portibacter marinus]|uniref:response regulator n=1 Tax=Portibacter marinus TaxID=2898660 RepID=UPI001F46F9C0|nr:response regulator transcription factor [Portibacter marinus]